MHELNNDPHARPSSEQDYGTKHPSRYEPKQSTVGNTQPQQRIRARSHGNAATQSIPDNTATDVVFDTTDFDPSGLRVGNTYVIPSTGKVTGPWLLHTNITWVAGAAGLREVDILSGGSIIASAFDIGGAAGLTSLDAMVLVNDPNAGTVFKVQAKQTSGGGALNLDKAAARTYFEAIHLW